MILTSTQIANMIDISAVKTDSSLQEVDAIIEAAIKYKFIAVFTLPCYGKYAKEKLAAQRGIMLGGTVGFPSGASTTTAKLFEAGELIDLGCDELDMVINVGKLKSRLFQDVNNDIKAIVKLAHGIPVKVILEVSLLNEAEIIEGSKIIRDSGASFIKTGTGWFGPTTFDHIELIKKTVGNSIQLKVAGGVRKLETLIKMHEMGVSRFGIGHVSAINIMEEYLRSK